MLRLLKIPFTKGEETEFFYEVVLESLKQRRESKMRRHDLIDLMMDAIKGDVSEDDYDTNEEQFEKVFKYKKYELEQLFILISRGLILGDLTQDFFLGCLFLPFYLASSCFPLFL